MIFKLRITLSGFGMSRKRRIDETTGREDIFPARLSNHLLLQFRLVYRGFCLLCQFVEFLHNGIVGLGADLR